MDSPSPRASTRSSSPVASSSVSTSRERRLVAARLDPRGEAEQVEQVVHLLGGGLDQVEEARLRCRRARRRGASVFAKPLTVASGVRRSWQASDDEPGELRSPTGSAYCGAARRSRSRNRFSVPARSRRRFARCRKMTAAALSAAEDDHRRRVAEQRARQTGSDSAEAIDATDV